MSLEATPHLFVVHRNFPLTELYVNERRISFDVSTADFERSILEQIDDKYDLLLLDWELTTPNARGVLDAFRQNAPETRVLALTDDIPIKDPVDRGADEFLVTPVTNEKLNSTIERLLFEKAYEKAVNDFFRLSTERALLENELDSGVNVTAQYHSVTRELRECRERAAAIRDEFSDEEFDRSLRQLLDE